MLGSPAFEASYLGVSCATESNPSFSRTNLLYGTRGMESTLIFTEKGSELLHVTLIVSLIENPQQTRTGSPSDAAGVRIIYGERSSTT